MSMPKLERRRFLRGVGGALVALPGLESLRPRSAHAATDSFRFFVAMRQGNGVQQQTETEPNRFWPDDHGPLTVAGLEAQSDKAMSELAAHAEDLLLVSGTRFGFSAPECAHNGGGNQCLTAARISEEPSGNESRAMGESIDNRICAQLDAPGVEPLTLMAGRRNGYIDEVLSYRGPMDLRGADDDPWVVFERLFSLEPLEPALRKQLRERRRSVNDLVGEQMRALMTSSTLSADDRRRLELHRASIRDLEVELSCVLPPEDEKNALESMSPVAQDDANIEQVARMQLDLIVLAFSCGLTHAATLQIGSGNDMTSYTVDGTRLPAYHAVSHRLHNGESIEGSEWMHHQIDRIHARMFRHLIERLAEVSAPSGERLLDRTVALWTNDLRDRNHSFRNIPQVIAGSGGGYLRTGRYIDAGGVTHNRLLNTILNAVGCTKADGAPVDDFGDSSLSRGEINGMKA